MTVAQKVPTSNQAVLNKFLFGNVSTLLKEDVVVIAGLALFIFAVIALCWKECMVYVFDPIFTHTMGFNLKIIESVLTVLLVIAITMGLQTVGVVLMSTMLIAP